MRHPPSSARSGRRAARHGDLHAGRRLRRRRERGRAGRRLQRSTPRARSRSSTCRPRLPRPRRTTCASPTSTRSRPAAQDAARRRARLRARRRTARRHPRQRATSSPSTSPSTAPRYVSAAGGERRRGRRPRVARSSTDLWSLGTRTTRCAQRRSTRATRTAGSRIRTWPGWGLYMPDAIALVHAGGQTYLVTANEGDAREWGDYVEPSRVKDLGEDGYGPVCADGPLAACSPTTPTWAGSTSRSRTASRRRLLLRASCTRSAARSFSIWTTDGDQVFDSGDAFEQITAAAVPGFFNSNHSESEPRRPQRRQGSRARGRHDRRAERPHVRVRRLRARRRRRRLRHHRPRGIRLRHLRQQPRLLGVGGGRDGPEARRRRATWAPRAWRSFRRSRLADGRAAPRRRATRCRAPRRSTRSTTCSHRWSSRCSASTTSTAASTPTR